MARGRPPRVEPLVVFVLALTLVIGFIVILIGAWDVPTPVCEQRIILPRDALVGIEPLPPETPPTTQCV